METPAFTGKFNWRRLRQQLISLRNDILATQKKSGRWVTATPDWGTGTLLAITDAGRGRRGGGKGACCHGEWPSLICSIETPAGCASLGGNYLGDGTPCEGVDCNSGACCEFDGGCSDTQEFLCGDCSISNSCWKGYGTKCDTTRCEGACCCIGEDSSRCTENLTYDECLSDCPSPPNTSQWLLEGTCADTACGDNSCCPGAFSAFDDSGRKFHTSTTTVYDTDITCIPGVCYTATDNCTVTSQSSIDPDTCEQTDTPSECTGTITACLPEECQCCENCVGCGGDDTCPPECCALCIGGGCFNTVNCADFGGGPCPAPDTVCDCDACTLETTATTWQCTENTSPDPECEDRFKITLITLSNECNPGEFAPPP